MSELINQQDKQNKIPTSLSPRQALAYLQAGAAIVDIRPEFETSFRIFDVPKVYYLSYRSYREDYPAIPKDCLLIVADSVGNQSQEVARFMLEKGYDNITFLAGGIVEWDRDGLPLAKDMDCAMIGGCACRLQPQKIREDSSLAALKSNE